MISEDERVLLWAAVEDVTGMWEAEWELRSRRPEWSNDRLRRCAHVSLKELLRLGYIELFTCQEPYGQLTALDATDSTRAIHDLQWWEPPAFEGISVRFAATPAGRAAYNESCEERS